MDKLRKLLHSRKNEILVIIIFLLLSLRVVTWFEHPNILISGDYRPQLNQEAFTNRVSNTWDQTDYGMPSVYAPRILVPSYFFMTIFNILGANTYTSQISALLVMMFLSSTLMYIFTKQFLKGDIIASFISGLYVTANIYMINDREVTAVAFLDTVLTILPCLILFALSISKKSYKYAAFSGILFTLTYSSFPNYRNPIISIIWIGLILIFYFIQNRKIFKDKTETTRLNTSFDPKILLKGLKHISAFFFSAALASIWIIAILWNNFDALTQTYGEMGNTYFAFEGINLHDSLRLILKWGFYSDYMGNPYVPYSSEYLQNPLVIFFSYLPTILAVLGVLTSKERKTTVFFTIIAVIFLALASGFNPYFSGFYLTIITKIPLMLAFREAAQWSFFVVITFGILIGMTSTFLIKKSSRQNATKIAVAGLVVVTLLASTYPLTIGEISRNPLDSKIRGAYFPSAYEEINAAINSDSWTLLIPEKTTYTTYNFSGIPLGAGNIYPLVFSKPIISGLGTEYMQSNNRELIQNLYALIKETNATNIAPEGVVSASSCENENRTSNLINDLKINTRWVSESGIPQWFEIEWPQKNELSKIEIVFENAYANSYEIQIWNGTDWNTQLFIKNNDLVDTTHVFKEPVTTEKIRVKFTEAKPFDLISIYELRVFTTESNTDAPKILGVLGIKNLFVEKNLLSGALFDINQITFFNDHKTEIKLIQDSDEVALYENQLSLQKIYAANKVTKYTDINDMFNKIGNITWTTLQQTAFINRTLNLDDQILNCTYSSQSLSWHEDNPTKYTIKTNTNSPFILGLLESYDSNWKLQVNGKQISEEDHIQINSYANGWLIRDTGELTITIEYAPQKIFTRSVIASLVLPLILIVILFRKDIKKAVTVKYNKN